MKALAASFVVTVGLAACTPAQSPEEPVHGNPPEPPIETYNPPGPEGEEPVPETPEEDEPKAELPPAPPDANVSKRADGTCWATAKVDCPPPPATCNPPPPQQVACPDE
jgi:hypothetical protein